MKSTHNQTYSLTKLARVLCYFILFLVSACAYTVFIRYPHVGNKHDPRCWDFYMHVSYITWSDVTLYSTYMHVHACR